MVVLMRVFDGVYMCASFQGVRSASVDAVARLAQFDADQLPPAFRGVVSVVRRAAQLFSDIKTDIMDFYQVRALPY